MYCRFFSTSALSFRDFDIVSKAAADRGGNARRIREKSSEERLHIRGRLKKGGRHYALVETISVAVRTWRRGGLLCLLTWRPFSDSHCQRDRDTPQNLRDIARVCLAERSKCHTGRGIHVRIRLDIRLVFRLDAQHELDQDGK